MANRLRLVALLGILVITPGCLRGCTSRSAPIHPNPNMFDQPRYSAQAASSFFPDGKTMRTPVEGTVPRGPLPETLRTDARYLTGKEPDGSPVAHSPVAVDDTVLARGEERYGIYCAPCHHKQGNGKGVLFTRANIPTTSLYLDRLRTAPDGQIFDTITNGQGLMPSYRYPISAADRWAIIAYVRKLQADHPEEKGQ
jgi:mono/diheme cytochrome c family protein